MDTCYQDCKYWDYDEAEHGDGEIEPMYNCSHPAREQRECVLIKDFSSDWDKVGDCGLLDIAEHQPTVQ